MWFPWKSFFLLLLLHAGLHSLAAAEQCQHKGQCLGGNLLKEILADSFESCITQGGQMEGAKFVTWKTTKVCQAFSYCQSVDVEAKAVTGALECKARGTTRACVGQIYAFLGKLDCRQLCLETPLCDRFTYLEQKHCLIFADCTSLTTNKKSCHEVTSITPSPTAVPSTSTPTTAPPISPPSTSTSATTAMNKILYFDGETGNTTLVSLDGTTANCALEDYPANSKHPAAVSYDNGEVLACGGQNLEDADRCWRFNGSTWSPLPNSNQKHCFIDSPNVRINDGWWVTGILQTGDDSCSWSRTSGYIPTSEVYTGRNWIPGPTLPVDEYPIWSCVINLNTTHTFLIGGGIPNCNDAWIYDWSTQAWTKTGSLIYNIWSHGCVSLGGKGILVVGGGNNGVELYDPVQGIWNSQPDLPNDIPSYAPLLLNWDDQILAMFHQKEQIYKWSEETGNWSVLNGVRLPKKSFPGYFNDKAVLVPDSWSCNPAE